MVVRAWITSPWDLACEELEVVDSTLRVVMSVHIGLNSMGLLQWGTRRAEAAISGPTSPG